MYNAVQSMQYSVLFFKITRCRYSSTEDHISCLHVHYLYMYIHSQRIQKFYNFVNNIFWLRNTCPLGVRYRLTENISNTIMGVSCMNKFQLIQTERTWNKSLAWNNFLANKWFKWWFVTVVSYAKNISISTMYG